MRNNESRSVKADDGKHIGWIDFREHAEGWAGELYTATSVHRSDHLQAHRSEQEAEKWIRDQHELHRAGLLKRKR
ncbi:MAG: hypothetical protein ACRDSK_13745 [Actinophytocola sp.]|uniref:hypothetical protein n=1 Tax=Actinophytocola sp. TaxID=1872138 RepID=UPI003D6B8E11